MGFNTTIVWVRPVITHIEVIIQIRFNTTIVWVRLAYLHIEEAIKQEFQYNDCLGSTKGSFKDDFYIKSFNTTIVWVRHFIGFL